MIDKQIEEMTKVIARRSKAFRNPNIAFMTTAEKTAESLYNADYRKASDVALETVDSFQRILRHIFLNMCNGNDYERLNLLQIDGAIEALYDSFIAELKKKYESEGEK